jgi:hypothetical protein
MAHRGTPQRINASPARVKRKEVKVNKQQFVLNELSALASDMAEMVKRELENQREAIRFAEKIAEKRREEAEKQPLKDQITLRMVATPYDPQHLREELGYFMDRLRSVHDYLFSDSTDIASTTRFLSELAHKLTR